MHPPSVILQQCLTDLGFGTVYEDDVPWPVFATVMPDEPHELIVVYDTTGTLDGRYMEDHVYVEHPGFQVRVRSRRYADGWAKARELWAALSALVREPVTVDEDDYVIQSVAFTSPIAVMGQDPETQRRENFSINGRLTLNS